MYYVRDWDTDEVLGEYKKLATARRYCRGRGHTGQDNGAYYAPVAYVEDEEGLCVYNPRFSVSIGAAAGGLINSCESDSF